MAYKDVLDVLAPCGLNCAKCFAFYEGEVGLYSARLQDLLGDFDRYAERFSRLAGLEVFSNYPSFKELLSYLAQADCRGCRNGDCRYTGCGVITCYRQMGVDFCFECPEFPCARTNFDPDLERRWRQMNTRMREVGPEEYLKETRDLPRYR
ncbi:MAG: DUF3795 domain-containing protein [Bacillota bacterium]